MSYRTPHFNPEVDTKMVCSCCGQGGLSIATLIVLEHIRQQIDAPITILSGARCTKYNAQVGGSKNSEHKVTDDNPLSDAVDITVKGMTTKQLHMIVQNLPYANLLGIGYYPKNGFVHIDTRGYAARW